MRAGLFLALGGLGQEAFGRAIEVAELGLVGIGQPTLEDLAGQLGMELHAEAATRPERLHARVAVGQDRGPLGHGEPIEVPLEPGPGRQHVRDVGLDPVPAELGAGGGLDRAPECGGQGLAPEAHAEHRDLGGVGGAEQVQLPTDPRPDPVRVVDRPRRAHGDDEVVVLGIGERRGGDRVGDVGDGHQLVQLEAVVLEAIAHHPRGTVPVRVHHQRPHASEATAHRNCVSWSRRW